MDRRTKIIHEEQREVDGEDGDGENDDGGGEEKEVHDKAEQMVDKLTTKETK